MYICKNCNALFESPKITVEYVPTEHGYAPYTTHECPECEEADYSTADRCPNCGEFKAEGYALCRDCRDALKAKFIAFAGELTCWEEEQLDDWLDGRSIKEREDF